MSKHSLQGRGIFNYKSSCVCFIWLRSFFFNVYLGTMKRTGKANQNARGRTLETLVFNWATFMSATGSVHGLSWFNYFEKPLFKGFVLTFALGCFCFIPTYFYLTLKDFLQDDSIFTKEVDRPMELVEFPHVTVCHPFYFDKEKMMGEAVFQSSVH